MNLKNLFLLVALFGMCVSHASADISSRPTPTPLPGAKLTFKQKWKRFFTNVSDDFHMESPQTRQADKFHENLRKPKDPIEPKKLTRKERKALEKSRKQALATPYVAPSSGQETIYGPATVEPVSYHPIPATPEPLAYDPVAP